MSRAWKPGDVAIRRDLWGGEQRSFVLAPSGCKAVHGDALHWRHADGGWDDIEPEGQSISAYRAVVVIDPEDAEQVERLVDAFYTSDGYSVPAMVEALRSLIALTKPEEPTGLGAVVEDTGGNRWVRADVDGAKPWTNGESWGAEWSHIAAVRVLSEGIQS